MRTQTVEYKLYTYAELTDNAKEKVKKWYLEGQEPYFFTDTCEEDLKALFGNDATLNVQYSLSYCQGDGLNIYGKINAKDIFNCLENRNGGEQLAQFENVLTEKEKKTILHYQEECGEIELPINNRYCYSLASYIDIANNWEYELENYSNFKNINIEVLNKFETLVQGIFETLCGIYEEWGYNYFYEVSEEDLAEICEVNGYEFLASGKIF